MMHEKNKNILWLVLSIFGLVVVGGIIVMLLKKEPYELHLPVWETQEDWQNFYSASHIDITTVPGEVRMKTLPVEPDPQIGDKKILFLSDQLTGLATTRFLLNAYFPEKVTYKPFSDIASLEDLLPYDIVITRLRSKSNLALVNQDLLYEYAKRGNLVVEHLLEYALKSGYEYHISDNITYKTPGSTPRGMAWDGKNLWIVDRNTQLIHKVDVYSGTVVGSIPAPDSKTTGLTWDGEYLWAAGTDGDMLFRLSPESGTVVDTMQSPGSAPQGLAWDGTYLWHADSKTDEIYKIDINLLGNERVVQTFPAQFGRSRDLAWDGNYLWVADTEGNCYYKVDYENGYPLEFIDSLYYEPQGLVFIDGKMWNADEEMDWYCDVFSSREMPYYIIKRPEHPFIVPFTNDNTPYIYIPRKDGRYDQRRVMGIEESDTITILAKSNRGGATLIEEKVGDGVMVSTMDLAGLCRNYETRRTAFNINAFFLKILGIDISQLGIYVDNWMNYGDLASRMEKLAKEYPEITIVDEGTASNGEMIKSLNIGDLSKPLFLFVGGFYGDEPHIPISLVAFAKHMAQEQRENTDLMNTLLSSYAIKIIPCINPHGLNNRVSTNAAGVDIEKNFDYEWNEYSAPGQTKGTAPFSEPESAVIREIVKRHTVIFCHSMHLSAGWAERLLYGRELDDLWTTDMIYKIFSTTVKHRWYEEKKGKGRWVGIKYYKALPPSPQLCNWMTSQGILATTSDIMGTKDTTTYKTLYVSSWVNTLSRSILQGFLMSHAEIIVHCPSDALRLRSIKVITDEVTPPGTIVKYLFGSSKEKATLPERWYEDIKKVPKENYLFIKARLLTNTPGVIPVIKKIALVPDK